MKCFYHNDIDGICSAAIINMWNKGAGEYFPINYKDVFPFDSINKDEMIVIVDFSLQKEGEFEKLLSITKNVIWIDHHKSAIEKHGNMGHLTGVREIGKAGCELTWEWCFSKTKIPLAVSFAGRYDVWDFSKYGKNLLYSFQTGIRLEDHNPTNNLWRELFENEKLLESVVEKGKIALKYRENNSRSLAKAFSFSVTFHGHKAICCNVGMTGSHLFESVKEGYDLMMPFIFDGEQWTVSIYSEKDIDCSEIAKQYGGGGHKKAAGFQCKELPFKKEV